MIRRCLVWQRENALGYLLYKPYPELNALGQVLVEILCGHWQISYRVHTETAEDPRQRTLSVGLAVSLLIPHRSD